MTLDEASCTLFRFMGNVKVHRFASTEDDDERNYQLN